MSEPSLRSPRKIVTRKPLVLLAAGGTGGHLFPAEALADALSACGIDIDLATDERAARYADVFPARKLHVLPADTLRGRSPLALARTGIALARGVLKGYQLMQELKPAVVVGFGGYPTVPPLLAARFAGRPTIIHEANAVLGRANAMLAPRVTGIATGYPDIFKDKPQLAAKARHTGNPVRPAVIDAATPYEPPLENGPFDLLVFGGSQGARIMSDVVPLAIAQLPPILRDRLRISQQARAEDSGLVRDLYAKSGVRAEVAPFFRDLPGRMSRAHLVIARAGASTIAELCVIGRPSILVPLPGAIDQDQLANATALTKGGGAVLARQSGFTPDTLAELLISLMRSPAQLAGMAQRAQAMGRADATARLADLVIRTAGLTV